MHMTGLRTIPFNVEMRNNDWFPQSVETFITRKQAIELNDIIDTILDTDTDNTELQAEDNGDFSGQRLPGEKSIILYGMKTIGFPEDVLDMTIKDAEEIQRYLNAVQNW